MLPWIPVLYSYTKTKSDNTRGDVAHGTEHRVTIVMILLTLLFCCIKVCNNTVAHGVCMMCEHVSAMLSIRLDEA